MLSHSSTGMPVADARDDFLRARRAQVAARAARWVAGGRRRARVSRTLTDSAGVPRGAARLEVIPLKAVVGTVEPTIMFDARFHPTSELVRSRWERIALAHRRAVSLPPIRVLRGKTARSGLERLVHRRDGRALRAHRALGARKPARIQRSRERRDRRRTDAPRWPCPDLCRRGGPCDRRCGSRGHSRPLDRAPRSVSRSGSIRRLPHPPLIHSGSVPTRRRSRSTGPSPVRPASDHPGRC
jgi:hypothetical protein